MWILSSNDLNNAKIVYLCLRALDERQKFEEETSVANELLIKLRSDNEDIINHLKRNLQSLSNDSEEMKERIKGLQLVRSLSII